MASSRPTHAEHSLPDGWRQVQLGDVAEVRNGTAPSCRKPEYWGAEGIPFVKTGQVNNVYILKPNEFITPQAMQDAGMKFTLPPPMEQEAIAAALEGVDATLEVAREEAARLRLLKESTADALLTGRVRIAGFSEDRE